MTRRDQKKFIRDLSASVVKSISEQIDRGQIPEGWDDHELRCLLAYRHGLSADMTSIRKEPRGRRARAFKNTIIIENL